MEKVTETRMVEQTITRYKACDGKLFDSPTQCDAYERGIIIAGLAAIEQCEEARDNPNFDGSEYPDYHDYTWYKPKNEEEINLLNDAYELDSGYLTYDHIGKWVCVESTADYAFVSALDDGISYVKEVLRRLGYDMTITEK